MVVRLEGMGTLTDEHAPGVVLLLLEGDERTLASGSIVNGAMSAAGLVRLWLREHPDRFEGAERVFLETFAE